MKIKIKILYMYFCSKITIKISICNQIFGDKGIETQKNTLVEA